MAPLRSCSQVPDTEAGATMIHSNCGTNKQTSPTMREALVIYGRSSVTVTVRAHLPNCADRFWSPKPFSSGT
jgi:hypothetical protein